MMIWTRSRPRSPAAAASTPPRSQKRSARRGTGTPRRSRLRAGPGRTQDDAWSERFAEVDAATAGLRNLTPHEYGHFSGPWLENAWITRWRDQPKEAFGGRVPVFAQWTDAVFLRGTDDATDAVIAASVEALKAAMRPDVAYVTVSQHSLGLRGLDAGLADLKNLLVLSAGGAGDVALPLVADGITRPFDDGGEFTAALLPRKYTFLLCGRATHAVRRRIADIIAGDSTLDAATVTYFGQDWRSRLNEATYVVAPRGYGRSSFFLYECLAAGALPIYVYDDEPWLPYALPVDVVRVDALGDGDEATPRRSSRPRRPSRAARGRTRCRSAPLLRRPLGPRRGLFRRSRTAPLPTKASRDADAAASVAKRNGAVS